MVWKNMKWIRTDHSILRNNVLSRQVKSKSADFASIFAWVLKTLSEFIMYTLQFLQKTEKRNKRRNITRRKRSWVTYLYLVDLVYIYKICECSNTCATSAEEQRNKNVWIWHWRSNFSFFSNKLIQNSLFCPKIVKKIVQQNRAKNVKNREKISQKKKSLKNLEKKIV